MVVFNNFRFKSQRKRVEAYGTVMGVDHGNPDFARLAELFGCRGYRVDQPGSFDETFREARDDRRPLRHRRDHGSRCAATPHCRQPGSTLSGRSGRGSRECEPAGYEALAVESNGALGSHRNMVDSQRLTSD